MLRYVYGHDQVIARFVAALIPHVGWRGFPANSKAFGVIDEDGKLIAGLVYTNWNPDAATIEISGAAVDPRWLTRETLRRMFSYPFDECACQMVVMRVLATNERLLRQLAAYGFNFVEVKRLFGRHQDGVICSLTVEDWRNNKFNKRDVLAFAPRIDGVPLVKEAA
jgi:RimJ/RimL family protein N-acetyltransferase